MSGETNQLLKEGARVITEASDIFKILGMNTTDKQTALNLTGDNETETVILQAMASGILDQDGLRLETKLSIRDVQSAISKFELRCRIAQDSLGLWRIL